MAFNNRNNLSNESAPWGREVEQKIESNTYDLNQLRLLTENNNKATNGTLSALTRQQQTLAEQQRLISANTQVYRLSQTIDGVPQEGGTFYYNLGPFPEVRGVGEFLVTATIYPFSYAIDDYFEGICSLQILDVYVPEIGPTNVVTGSGTMFAGHVSGSLTPTLVASIQTEIVTAETIVEVVLTYSDRDLPYSGEAIGVKIDVAIQPRYSTLN